MPYRVVHEKISLRSGNSSVATLRVMSGTLFLNQSPDAVPDIDAFGVLGREFTGIHPVHMHDGRGPFHREGQRFVESDQFFGFIKVQSCHDETLALPPGAIEMVERH
jgi:hypothetical protein